MQTNYSVGSDLAANRLLALIKHAMGDHNCPHVAETTIVSFLHPSSTSSNLKVWKTINCARFKATLHWWPQEQVWQIVYAGDLVFGKENRRDAVVYKFGLRHYFGIIQAIFKHRRYTLSRIALIRRLNQEPLEDGNRFVIEKFQNKRFAYEACGEGIMLDCVASSSSVSCGDGSSGPMGGL